MGLSTSGRQQGFLRLKSMAKKELKQIMLDDLFKQFLQNINLSRLKKTAILFFANAFAVLIFFWLIYLMA